MSVKEFAYLIQNQFCLKVNEIAFINTLEAQNKKMEVMSRHQVYYTNNHKNMMIAVLQRSTLRTNLEYRNFINLCIMAKP